MVAAAMSVVYVLTTPIPENGENATMDQIRRRNKWDNDEYHTLKHKKKELNLVELGSHLRIEESPRAQYIDKPKGNNVIGSHLMSTFKLNDSILWHARLGHIHFKRMQDMSKDGLIPAFDMDTEKCKSCMLTKITKKPFQNVKRETKVLELIHSDLCDLHATPSLGNKKYFVTFIDVALRTDRGGEHMDTLYFQSLELKQIGKRCRVAGNRQGKENFDERGIECIFVRYIKHSKAFRFSLVLRPSLRIPNGTKDIGGSVVPEEVDGTIENFKARLVIQGFKQKSGIDYFNTYALVTHMSTIRLLTAMASIHNLIIHQMDVKTSFLNGELDEEIYMNQP
ncbi:zinc finger, CCHC-type containing protein [Tanacetum coccineum]